MTRVRDDVETYTIGNSPSGGRARDPSMVVRPVDFSLISRSLLSRVIGHRGSRGRSEFPTYRSLERALGVSSFFTRLFFRYELVAGEFPASRLSTGLPGRSAVDGPSKHLDRNNGRYTRWPGLFIMTWKMSKSIPTKSRWRRRRADRTFTDPVRVTTRQPLHLPMDLSSSSAGAVAVRVANVSEIPVTLMDNQRNAR